MTKKGTDTAKRYAEAVCNMSLRAVGRMSSSDEERKKRKATALCRKERRALSKYERQVDRAGRTQPVSRARLGLELERLKQSPKIEKVSFKKGILRVRTSNIVCTDVESKERWSLGRMVISVGLGRSRKIRIQNIDHPFSMDCWDGKRTYAAPHVRNGIMCTGNEYGKILPEILYDPMATIYSVIQFLETVDDGGTFISPHDIFEWEELD